MISAKYDVLGLGNAIFDVLVQTDESFLATHGMTKGGMTLINEERAILIYQSMGQATEMSAYFLVRFQGPCRATNIAPWYLAGNILPV